MLLRLLIVFCGATIAGRSALASGESTTVASSGPGRVSLIELFTSEGCSSCPPAEQRMGQLLGAKRLWSGVVPVAFHVDYWDYLGWKDRAASPAFTARQQAYAQAWNASSVYTPEFIVDGTEWRNELPDRPVGNDAPGRLVVDQDGAHGFHIAFFPAAAFPGGIASLALLGFDRAADVRSGENAGRRLVHQFVVLTLAQSPLTRDAGSSVWRATIPPAARFHGRLAIAAWVSLSGGVAPVQAAGGWLAAATP